MGCYDTGSDTDTGFRYFFGFSRKSIAESIGIQIGEKLVMGGSDTGSDKKIIGYRFFGFSSKLSKIERGIDPDNF
jgi:hypothetical protein